MSVGGILMRIGGNALRPGQVILHQNRLWVITKTQHTQPGKGGAYMQAELKDIKDGTKKNERFRSSETVEKVFLEEVPYRYLYQQQEEYTFMHPESYQQISLGADLLNVSPDFLQENMEVSIGFYEDAPIFVNLPAQVVLTIVETDMVVKGQTASSSYKPAQLENGMRIMVPPHIEAGIKVVVNTEDGTYVERFKGDLKSE